MGRHVGQSVLHVSPNQTYKANEVTKTKVLTVGNQKWETAPFQRVNPKLWRLFFASCTCCKNTTRPSWRIEKPARFNCHAALDMGLETFIC